MDRNVYKDIMEHLPVAACCLIEDRIVLNKRAREFTGFQGSDILSVDNWFDYNFKDQASIAKEAYLQAKKENFPHPFRVRFVKKNGDIRITDLTGSLANDVETWLIDDVTDKIMLEERYTILFNQSTDAHLLLDTHGIIDCNFAAVKMINAKSKEQLLSLHPAVFSPEYQPDGMKSTDKKMHMDQIARDEGYHRFEWVHRKLTGEEFPVEVTLNAVDVAGRSLLLVVWHDLTEIKEAHARLEEERSRNFHAAKMATLGEMASGIAHEINNPLTVILNRVLQMKNQIKQDPPLIDAAVMNADKVTDIVNRISKIIKGLRNFARDGAKDSYEFYPVRKILDETLDMCQSRFYYNNVALRRFHYPDESALEVELFCVPVQIQQVLMNLLNNSFDAVVGKTPNWVEIDLRIEGAHVWICVTDSGEGIPDLIKNKIMQPFFTTKDIGKGTGLGLSISRGIVEAHNGEIFLDDDSKNTRFVVKLPLISRANVPHV